MMQELTMLGVMESMRMAETLWPFARKPSRNGAVLFATDALSSVSTMVIFPAVVETRSDIRTMGSLRLALGVTMDASATALMDVRTESGAAFKGGGTRWRA